MTASGGEARLSPHRQRIAVVTFALSGATALAETHDPAEVLRVMNGFHATVAGLVGSHEATVASATADVVTVLFNDPLPCSDPVARARRLAVAVGEELAAPQAEWRQRSGVELTLGVGIALGEATLGRVGPDDRCDYVALGAVVDRAASLAQAARQTGGVLLDDEAQAALDLAAAPADR